MKNNKLRVLMISRETLYSSPGGDTVQIENTAKYLTKLGNLSVDIKVSSDLIEYRNYDILHFFNIIRPNDFLFHIKNSNLPFVISTIFVDYSEYEKKARKGFIGFLNSFISANTLEYLKVVAKVIKRQEKLQDLSYLWLGQQKSIQLLLNQASLLLPNSQSEYQRLKKSFHVTQNYQVIPNAIDDTVFNQSISNIDTKYKNSIICVGRIEGRKNQLNLIKAVNKTNFKLFIIGKKSPNQNSYYHDCKKEAQKNKNIEFINHMSQKELALVMKAAKVHALISWFETTGLVSLEAAYLGCNLVITKKGDQYEYFSDMVTYCTPDDIDNIKEALNISFQKPFNKELQKKIKNEYTWEKTAEKTYQAYQVVLTGKK